MNRKKLYIALAILAVLLMAALIVYLCFFGKAKDPDEATEKSEAEQGVNYDYRDADGNVIDGPVSYESEEEKAEREAALKKAEEDNKAAVEEISGNLTFPSEFAVETAKADFDDDGVAGNSVKYNLKAGDTELVYSIDREPETIDFTDIPRRMSHEVKSVGDVSIDIVGDDEGCIAYWRDASGREHKLVVPLDMTDQNIKKILEWAELLINNAD